MPKIGFGTIEIGKDIDDALKLESLRSNKSQASIVRDALRVRLRSTLLEVHKKGDKVGLEKDGTVRYRPKAL